MALERYRQWLHGNREVVGINQRNVELVYAHNRRTDYRFADDKLLAKRKLREAGVPSPETLIEVDGVHSIADAVARAAALEHFVVKPASSSGGRGIVVVGERSDEGGWRRSSGEAFDTEELRQHLANIVYGAFSNDESDRAYLERRIVAHSMLHELCPNGLSDLRVITLCADPLMAMMRVPTVQSQGRANLHQGALGLAIDLVSGTTFRALHRGQAIRRHPDTGRALLGLAVPNWTAVLDVAQRAARSVPLGYLGVDIVLDQQATPLVLEINARPGLEIQNVNGRGLGVPLRQRQERKRV